MSATFPGHQVIVVGGGLAGFSAANTVLENGGRVVLLDKMAFCGGNSTKATSGINGSETQTQKNLGIKDSNEIFYQDTMRGGATQPHLAKVLCDESGPSVDWLVEKFDLDLSLLSQLGGHSAKRTHRGAARFPGFTITYALMQMAERVAEKNPDLCRIINKARVTKLITSPTDSNIVIGCEYERGGQMFREFGSVVIATGGFAADFTPDGLLAKYRPDILHLSTTNGEHCTGDGIRLCETVGGYLIDPTSIQVHPTGLVHPDDPSAKVKFLAAEALRGEGGILIDRNGKRFVNELGRRDFVTGEMWKNAGPFRLILNSVASKAIAWHCEHYKGRGIMKQYNSGAELAKDIGVDVGVIADTFKAYTETAQKVQANPDSGPYDAYPNGKTFDPYGKKFFNNPTFTMNEILHVSIVEPVIHYCMAGVMIDVDGCVVKKDGSPVNGLYAAGEVAGGVHGNNRLGGNSLLDCVVYGRLSGKHASKYTFGENVKNVNLKDIAAPVSKPEAPVASVATAPVASSTAIPTGHYTMEQVAQHNKKSDCWVVIGDEVLNVTSFLKDHPGGELAILTFAGRDATKEFNMLHPPETIKKYAPECVIGKIWSGAAPVAVAAAPTAIPGYTGPVYTLEQVAQHNKKSDCWVVIGEEVLNVTSFIKDHPGGELAILTFAGKDATKEFNMLHPPETIRKYAPECVIGRLAKGVSTAAPTTAVSESLKQPLLGGADASVPVNHWWGEARNTAAEHGVFGPSVSSFLLAVFSVVWLFIMESVKTIFTVKNWSVIHDKSGLTRSAVFLIVFVFIHGMGNLHVYGGPDHFNGYAYFLNRPVPWDTLFLPVEIYLLAAGLLHVLVATVRTLKFKKLSMITDKNMRGQLSLAFTGALLFVFLVIHLQQFRLTRVYPEYTFRVRWMWPFFCDRSDQSCEIGTFKDLYRMEFEIFEDWRWVVFYLFSVFVFVYHMSEGWGKVALASPYIPKKEKAMAKFIGIAAAWFIGLLYFSYPIFCYFFPVKDWAAYEKEHVDSWKSILSGKHQ